MLWFKSVRRETRIVLAKKQYRQHRKGTSLVATINTRSECVNYTWNEYCTVFEKLINPAFFENWHTELHQCLFLARKLFRKPALLKFSSASK